MPRARKQPPQAPQARTYGEATEALEAQRQIPLPQEPPVSVSPEDQPDAVDQLEALARSFDPAAGVTPLSAESTAPDEPVTAGLPVGPGEGPGGLADPFAVQTRNQVANSLELAAQISGKPALLEMAARARASARRIPRF